MISRLLLQRKNANYREVLNVCLPLVLSMSATTVMEFTDRVFLANYSIEAISAAAPAGVTAFLFMAFFGGIGGYSGVFIAQYFGSGSNNRIGAVLWQGIYFSLFSGLICWLIAEFATGPIFGFAGHEESVRILEEIYFSILCKGAVLHIAAYTLATFFTGRGITRPVMIFTLVSVVINIPLNYALIFGRWGLPEMGITGAALATVAAWGINVILLTALIFNRRNSRFGVFSAFAFDRTLLQRLLRFGVPGSLQFTLDILAFTMFLLLVGRIGTLELAVTNIVISINSVTFMPSMGVSQGISVMVGQALGRQDVKVAKQSVWSAIHMLLCYILVVDLIFIFFPEQILSPFIQAGITLAEQEAIMDIGAVLLRIIAAYILLDGMYMVFSGALKGAGDTRFLMISVGCTSIFLFIIPVYAGITWFDMGVGGAWLCVLLFIIGLFSLSAGRYRIGKWQKMLVIEKEYRKS